MRTFSLLLSGILFVCIPLLAQTVTDLDGNVYPTVTIGTQVWMAENLKVTHYANGDNIAYVRADTDWYNLNTGALSYYSHDTLNRNVYGNLYNGFAVLDSRNVCPEGWHVPTDDEWVLLERTICSSATCTLDFPYASLNSGWQGTDEGGKLKETGTLHWNSPNTGATNSSGMTVLPGGYRYWDGLFYTIGDYTILWTATEDSSQVNMWFRGILNNRSDVYKGYGDKKNGMSIRCVTAASGSGLEERENDQEHFYPNPATDRLYVNFSSSLPAKLQVYNLMGALVMECALKEGSNEVNLFSLAAGVYFLQCRSSSRSFQQKFIKQE